MALADLAALPDPQIAVPDVVSAVGHDNAMVAKLSNTQLISMGFEGAELTEQLIASLVSVCQGRPALEVVALRPKVIMRASA